MTELQSIAARIAERLIARKETVAVAESSAGGLIAAALLEVPGASRYFVSGAVVYTRAARDNLMGISDEQMANMRSSSEPYAQLLAHTCRMRFGATWGLAETGAAGPTGNSYGDKAGHTCLAVSGATERVTTLETGKRDRSGNMRAFAAAALALLEEALGPA